MAKILQAQHTLIAVFACISVSLSAQNSGELIAMNSELGIDETTVTEISNFTSVSDITATNFFQLNGKKIEPYMAVKNVKKEYQVVKVNAKERITLSFGTKSLEYVFGGQTYVFVVNGVDQFMNTSSKCLVRGKIEVSCQPVKIGKEKITSISLYFDQNNHISYIEVGDTELYLRP